MHLATWVVARSAAVAWVVAASTAAAVAETALAVVAAEGNWELGRQLHLVAVGGEDTGSLEARAAAGISA